ncbi:Mce protein [Mycolicibacterium sp. lyk4-40-TYG-92]|uniref:Mce protein n=1 Tax=Mycolicibacterium sp. lyk4-40-TYG-92 TaxID=3040295 RepID=UPI00254C739E|nr:Mce protein [Mycolicibacterium sp. lyk4-40-TYG-92]
MAIDVAATEQLNDTDDAGDRVVGDLAAAAVEAQHSTTKTAIVAGAAIAVGLVGLVGWLGYQDYRHRQADDQRSSFVDAAKQEAVNLTTISHTEVDKDVQRILDSSTGTFRDDFLQRSQPFIEVVKKVQSTSTGTVTEAGLEFQQGNQAQVLVAVSVKTATAGAPDEQLRHWRMRISVQRNGTDTKISNVEFVL